MAKNSNQPAPAPAPEEQPVEQAAAPIEEAVAAEDSAPAPADLKKVLLLVDCVAGKCASVVEIDAALAGQLIAAREADDNAAAIAAHEG